MNSTLPGSGSKILVIGGDSQIGRAIRSMSPPGARFLVRRPALTPDEHTVTDYAAVPPDLLDDTDVMINCVGVSQGSSTALFKINVDIPLALARRALTSPVRHIVHVSSFSVYGPREPISRHAAVAPQSEYGQSKAEADQALLELASADLDVTAVRLPAIVRRGGNDKLNRLIRMWMRTRTMPVPKTPVLRSMISADLAARTLLWCAREGVFGIVHAADPEPFEFHRAAKVISKFAPRNVACIRAPELLLDALACAAPQLSRSLYANSILDKADNVAIDADLSSDLYEIISDIAKTGNAKFL